MADPDDLQDDKFSWTKPGSLKILRGGKEPAKLPEDIDDTTKAKVRIDLYPVEDDEEGWSSLDRSAGECDRMIRYLR